MSFLKVFNNPHHSSTLSFRGLTHSVLVTLVVASIAFIFKPLGIKQLDSQELINVVVTISGITFGMMIIAQFLFPILIKDFYAEEKWTTGKQLVQLLIMSALICFSTTYYLGLKKLATFPIDGAILFGISILPLIIIAVLQQNLLKSKFEKLAYDKNQSLKHKTVISSNNPLNVLSFKSGAQSLNLIPNQLIYIQLGSPSVFYYQNFMGLEKSNLSLSKDEILKELQGHPQFELFGSEYIVNINAIQNVKGTARGYEIEIARIQQQISISHKERKKIDNL